MKKIVVYAGVLFLLIFTIGPLLSRRALIIMNIKYLPVSEWTKGNIVAAYFYFNDRAVPLERIREQFTYTDSLMILSDEQMMSKNKLYNLIGYDSPLFQLDVRQYFFYAIIKNSSMAGEESLDNEVHYVWLPWGWCYIKSEITAAA